jgi:hypothetical protein
MSYGRVIAIPSLKANAYLFTAKQCKLQDVVLITESMKSKRYFGR